MLKENELIGALTLARQEVGPWRTKADADLSLPRQTYQRGTG
jgi:hypothetical protein